MGAFDEGPPEDVVISLRGRADFGDQSAHARARERIEGRRLHQRRFEDEVERAIEDRVGRAVVEPEEQHLGRAIVRGGGPTARRRGRGRRGRGRRRGPSVEQCAGARHQPDAEQRETCDRAGARAPRRPDGGSGARHRRRLVAERA